MKTTLILTDFSPNSRNAADFAIGLQGFEHRRFILMNVYVEPFTSASDAIPIIDILESDSNEGLSIEATYLREKHAELDLSLKVLSEPGGLLFAIDRIIDSNDIDLIVMGTHGTSTKRRSIMGNNAAFVIKNTKVPVLLVPVGWKFKSPGHVVFATDNLPFRNIASLEPLIDLLKQYASRVSVVSILQGSSEKVTRTIENPQLADWLKDIPHIFHREWQKNVAEGLSDFVHENKVDMLCLVERKHSFLNSFFHSSITKRMSSLTDVPMLVLHDENQG